MTNGVYQLLLALNKAGIRNSFNKQYHEIDNQVQFLFLSYHACTSIFMVVLIQHFFFISGLVTISSSLFNELLLFYYILFYLDTIGSCLNLSSYDFQLSLSIFLSQNSPFLPLNQSVIFLLYLSLFLLSESVHIYQFIYLQGGAEKFSAQPRELSKKKSEV